MEKVDIKKVGSILNNVSENLFSKEESVWFNESFLKSMTYRNETLWDIFNTKEKRENILKRLVEKDNFKILSKKDFKILKLRLSNSGFKYEDKEDYFLFDNGSLKIIIYKHNKLFLPYYSANNLNMLKFKEDLFEELLNKLENF